MEWILGELKAFSEFYGTKIHLYPTEAYARETVTNLMEKHVVIVAEDESGLCGFIMGLMHPHFFNPAITVLTELFWWVQPAKRNTRAGLMLLNEFTAFGDEMADWITFTLEHHSPVKETCLLKRGFKLQERNFLKEVL